MFSELLKKRRRNCKDVRKHKKKKKEDGAINFITRIFI